MKHAKQVIIAFLVAILVAFPVFCLFNVWDPLGETKPIYEYETTTEDQPRVFITNYGDCYHHIDCQYLWNSRKAVGIYEARSDGYAVCTVCGGIPSGTVTVVHEKRILVDEEIVKNNTANVVFTVLTFFAVFSILFVAQEIWHEKKQEKLKNIDN